MKTSDTQDFSEERYREALQQTHQALAETQALYHVARSLIGFKSLSDLLQDVVNHVAEALPADRVALIAFDLDTQQVVHHFEGGPGIADMVEVSFDELWDGLSGWAIREMKPALSVDNNDPRESPSVQRRRAETNCGSIVVVPLSYQNKIFGTMTAINRPDERAFTQRDVELMEMMASQSAMAIENARLYALLEASKDRLEQRVIERTAELAETNTHLQKEVAERTQTEQNLHRVNRAFRTLSSCNQLLLHMTVESDLLQATCHTIKNVCGYRQVWIGLTAQDGTHAFRPVAQAGFGKKFLEASHPAWVALKQRGNPNSSALRSRLPVVQQAVHRTSAHATWLGRMSSAKLAAFAIFPLVTKGHVLGALHVYSTSSDAFDPEEVALLTELADDLAYGIGGLREQAERERVAQALQTSEKRYRQLVENMNDGLAVVDENLVITFVNPQVQALLGYGAGEMIGRPMESFLDETNRQILAAQIVRRRRGEPGVYELEWTTKDGRRISTRVSGTPLFDNRHMFLGSFAVVTDITETRRAEKERQSHLWFLESMDRVNRAMQGTNDLEQMMSDVLDAVLSVFDCDRAFLMYPCDPEAVSWTSPMERNKPEYPGVRALGLEIPMDPEVAATLRILWASDHPVKFGPGTSHPLPADVAERFGFKCFMSMALYPKVGKPWQFGIHQCAYARTWTSEEEQLLQGIGQRLADALTSLLMFRNMQESEQKFHSFVQSSSEGFTLVDEQGAIIEWNPAREEMTGLPASQVIGQKLWDVQYQMVLPRLQTPEFYERFKQTLLNALQTGQSPIFDQVIEAEVMHPDSPSQFIQQTLFPIKTDKGYRIGSVSSDITERKRAEEERLSHLRYFESMDRVNRTIQGTNDLEQMMRDAMDAALSIFDCDRAWLVYPCDPDASTWQVPMERSRPEYPGVLPIGIELPLDPAGAAVYRILRDASGPVQFGPGSSHPVPIEMVQGFDVQSFIAMAFYPKIGAPWAFGLHQCSYPRVWTSEEGRLVQAIGRRLADTLTSLLLFRNMRESEQKFRSFVQESSEGFALVDEQGTVIEWNRAREQMTGLTAKQVLGQPFWDVQPEMILPKLRTARRHERARRLVLMALQTGQSPLFDSIIETETTRPDGSHRFIQQAIFPIRTDKGYRIGSIISDITGRRRAEEALERQNQRLSMLYAVGQVVNSTLDVTEILDFVVDEAMRVSHAKRGQTLVADPAARVFERRSLRGFTLKEKARIEKMPLKLDQGLNGEAYWSRSVVNVGNVRQHHRYFPLIPSTRSELVVPILHADRVLGNIDLQSPKIDAFREMDVDYLRALAEQAALAIINASLYHDLELYSGGLEQAVAERTAELEATKDRVETILSSIGDALLVLHMDGRIEQVNPAFERQTGYSAVEAALKDHADLLKLEFGSKDDYQAALKTLSPGQVWHWETKVQRKNGSTYDALLTIAPIRDPLGAIRRLVASIRDITPLKEVERAKDQFVSNVSHELRTPITSLQLNQELLRRNPAEQEIYIERMKRELNRLTDLIENLLRLSRLDQGRVQLDLRPADLNHLATQYVEDRIPLAKNRELSLTLEKMADLPPAEADTGLLGQALSVLLTNALNYTPAGGRVTITTRQRDIEGQTWVGFSVADTGPGIPPEETPKLFSRFFRGSVGRKSGASGTGLGLAIAREIVERHQGRIEVASDGVPGHGTIFSVWLPAAEPSGPGKTP